MVTLIFSFLFLLFGKSPLNTFYVISTRNTFWNVKMSVLWVFVLLSCFLMTTNSSAIGEPKDVEKSPLPEVLDPNRGGQDQPMSEESQVLLQLKNASSVELNSSYCSQFDNSCVKCVKQSNCTMVKYTKETKTDIDVEDIEFECFDITASLEEIRQSFADKTYNVIQTVSDCPTTYSKRPILQGGVKSNAGTTTQTSLSSARTSTQSTLMDNTTITTDATNSTTGTSSETSTTMGSSMSDIHFRHSFRQFDFFGARRGCN